MNQRLKGQGLVEYALILVLVAVVVIAILALLGPTVGDIFSNITKCFDENVNYICNTTTQDNTLQGITTNTSSSSSQDVNKKGDDKLDSYKEFKDRSLYQEEASDEAKQQLQEALGETFEVLSEYALGIGDNGLYDLVIQAQQAASGDYSGLPSALADVFSAIGEAPTELQVSVVKKVETNVIKAYGALNDTHVSYELYEAALQEIEQYSGSADDMITSMGEAWDLVDQRNLLIGELQPELLTGACYGITILNDSGTPENIDLAQEYLAQLPPSSCDN